MHRFAALLALAAVLSACSGDAANVARERHATAFHGAESAAAESAATELRGALDGISRAPAMLAYGAFADPRTGDSLRGYVVRLVGPYDMVAGDVPPHDWLAEHLPANGWSLDAQADGPDGASYRAVHGDLVLYVLATWEDLHAPWEVPDWYAVTAGIEAARSAPHDSSRGAPREP